MSMQAKVQYTVVIHFALDEHTALLCCLLHFALVFHFVRADPKDSRLPDNSLLSIRLEHCGEDKLRVARGTELVRPRGLHLISQES